MCMAESPPLNSRGLLIKPYDIPAGIAEAGGDLRSVRADGLHDLPAVLNNAVKHGRYAIHHHIDKEPRHCGWRTSEYPRAAHLPGSVIERNCAITAFPGVPTEYTLVKLRRPCNISGRYFDVADIPVCAHDAEFYVYSQQRANRSSSSSALPGTNCFSSFEIGRAS